MQKKRTDKYTFTVVRNSAAIWEFRFSVTAVLHLHTSFQLEDGLPCQVMWVANVSPIKNTTTLFFIEILKVKL